MCYGQQRMDIMSCLRESDTDANKDRYNFAQFPAFLPEMQARVACKCPTIKIDHHQRARRIDAEPMNL